MKELISDSRPFIRTTSCVFVQYTITCLLYTGIFTGIYTYAFVEKYKNNRWFLAPNSFLYLNLKYGIFSCQFLSNIT